MPYEVIKANAPLEALKKSKWSIGDRTTCVEVRAIANSDGTFSVFPIFEKEQNAEDSKENQDQEAKRKVLSKQDDHYNRVCAQCRTVTVHRDNSECICPDCFSHNTPSFGKVDAQNTKRS